MNANSDPTRELLAEAGRQFRFYEQQHRAKQPATDDTLKKAEVNREFAERIEVALATPAAATAEEAFRAQTDLLRGRSLVDSWEQDGWAMDWIAKNLMAIRRDDGSMEYRLAQVISAMTAAREMGRAHPQPSAEALEKARQLLREASGPSSSLTPRMAPLRRPKKITQREADLEAQRDRDCQDGALVSVGNGCFQRPKMDGAE